MLLNNLNFSAFTLNLFEIDSAEKLIFNVEGQRNV